MGKRSFDQKLAHIKALRTIPTAQAEPDLRSLLKDTNNFVVGKAAKCVAERHISAFIPDVEASFERFLIQPLKTDPQCWAKIALAQALKDLAHSDPTVFLKGIAHIQMEPVWGGAADSAGPLRSICATALVSCSLPALQVLEPLTDLLADKEKDVRINAAHAIQHLSAHAGTLPLRLKIGLGDEPEVMGACFAALLALAPRDSVAFVRQRLFHPDPDIQMEAATALIDCPEPAAYAALTEFWDQQSLGEQKRGFLMLLGTSPHENAAAVLLYVIENASERDALEALHRLRGNRHAARVRDALSTILKDRGSSQLGEVLSDNWPAPDSTSAFEE